MPNPTKEWICYQKLKRKAPPDDQREHSPRPLFPQHAIPTHQSEHLEAFGTHRVNTVLQNPADAQRTQLRPPARGTKWPWGGLPASCSGDVSPQRGRKHCPTENAKPEHCALTSKSDHTRGLFLPKRKSFCCSVKAVYAKKTFSWNFWGRGSSIKSTLKGVLFWNISYQTTPSDFWAALLRRSKVSILHSHPLSRCTVLHLLACRAPNKGAKKKSTFLKTTVQSRIWLQIQPGTAHWLCSTSKDCFDTEPQDFIQLSPGLLLTAAGKQHKVLCTFWDL